MELSRFFWTSGLALLIGGILSSAAWVGNGGFVFGRYGLDRLFLNGSFLDQWRIDG